MKQALLQSPRDMSFEGKVVGRDIRGWPISVGAGDRRNAGSSQGYFGWVVCWHTEFVVLIFAEIM